MTYTHFNEIPLNTKCTLPVYICSISPSVTRQGTDYSVLELSDGKNKIKARDFNHTIDYYEGDGLVKSVRNVTLSKTEYNGADSYTIEAVSMNDANLDVEDFIIHAPYKGEDLYKRILGIATHPLVANIYEMYQSKLYYWSAAKSKHHNYYGGLLWHTYRMIEDAKSICYINDRYRDFFEKNDEAELNDKIIDVLQQIDCVNAMAAYKSIGTVDNQSKMLKDILIEIMLAVAFSKIYRSIKPISLDVLLAGLILSVYSEYYSKTFDPDLLMTMEELQGPNMFGIMKAEELDIVSTEIKNIIIHCVAASTCGIDNNSCKPVTEEGELSFVITQIRKLDMSSYYIDSDILLTAAALHDIGKIEEMNTDNFGTAEYTPVGKQIGHLYIGMKIVEDEAKKGSYDPCLIKNVIHCIASHHGRLDWNSIVEPKTIEAKLLHLIDYLDSHLEPMETEYNNMAPGAFSTSGKFGINLYKPDYSNK